MQGILGLPIQTRITFIRKTVSLFFLAGIFLSFKLWISNRFFPLVPVSGNLPVLPHAVNYGLAILLILLLGINLFLERRVINFSLILILLILLIADQNRWHPWVYIYFLLLILLCFPLQSCFPPQSIEKQLNLFSCLQLIIIGVYIWSGIHKLNPNFINITFYNILTNLFWFKSPELLRVIKPFGYFIPVVEIGIGLALYFPQFRNIGVYTAIITHLFILIYLSPLGINSNSAVYPWNVAMICLAFLLFYKVKDKIQIAGQGIGQLYGIAIILLIYMLPILNFFGYWDHYLSFSLYSDKTKAYYIAIGEKELLKIDKRLATYFLPIKGLQGGQIIDVNKWCLGELNVPFYPESRVFKQVAKTFCTLGIQEDQLYFLEFELPLEKGKYTRFTCKDLKD